MNPSDNFPFSKYAEIMNPILRNARLEKDQLHFSRALKLYQSLPPQQQTPEIRLETAQILAGAHRWKQAEKLLDLLAAEENLSLSVRVEVLLALMHLYTQTGRLNEASRIHHDLLHLEGARLPSRFWLYSAIYLYEHGRTDTALLAARRAASMHDEYKRTTLEAWVLVGDLHSSLGQLAQAEEAYKKALEYLDEFPENWRSLREALVWNSLADVYEQFDLFDMAEDAYADANTAMSKVNDPDIFDLHSYQLELLLSQANCKALQDELDDARELLHKARRILPLVPMPIHLYWKSRVDYLSGLCDLYSENPKLHPFTHLFDAWKEQEQFLLAAPAGSMEYLGKAAYYAAYCYDEDYAEGVSEKALYLQALDLFEKNAFRDPRFFLFSIASIENELGNLTQEESHEQSIEWYTKAVEGFIDCIRRWPLDDPARISCIAALLNLLCMLPDDKLAEYGAKWLDVFEEQFEMLKTNPENENILREGLDQLLENEGLCALYPKRIQKLHNEFGTLSA